ncbi:MAG: hypothetical protein AB1Z55_06930 [Acidimicrobiia bacterium]
MSIPRIIGSAVAGAAAYAVGVYAALFAVLSLFGLSDAISPWYPLLAIALGTAASAGAVALASGAAGRVWLPTALAGLGVAVVGAIAILALQTDAAWLFGVGLVTVAAETTAAATATSERTGVAA